MRGISLDSVELDKFGFKFDRRWMLIDENNKFVTQRQQTKMCLIDVSLTETGLLVSSNNSSELFIDFKNFSETSIDVKIWTDSCQAKVASGHINKWFSDFLQAKLRLVYMDDSEVRQVDQYYAKDPNKQVNFADGFPILLISQGSLNDLNQKLQAKSEAAVPMQRFRPNIVINNQIAFEEDQWHKVTIGDIEMAVVKPCSRCIIPTIDIQTASKSKQPLATLREYRQRADMKILFGQNLIHQQQGSLSLGDLLKVVE